jgi:hypothetical protein
MREKSTQRTGRRSCCNNAITGVLFARHLLPIVCLPAAVVRKKARMGGSAARSLQKMTRPAA